MNRAGSSLGKSLLDSLSSLGASICAAFASPAFDASTPPDAEEEVDTDIIGCMRGSLPVSGNPGCRYSEDMPGYLTSNGYGSLEIGAADD